MTSDDMQLYLYSHLSNKLRTSVFVPNVSWGLGIHECDMLIMRKSGFCVEIEIKVSISDLRADQKKSHGHRSEKIKELYYAIPSKMAKPTVIDLIPERAGLYVVSSHGKVVKLISARHNQVARALTEEEQKKLLYLAHFRAWRYFGELHSLRQINQDLLMQLGDKVA